MGRCKQILPLLQEAISKTGGVAKNIGSVLFGELFAPEMRVFLIAFELEGRLIIEEYMGSKTSVFFFDAFGARRAVIVVLDPEAFLAEAKVWGRRETCE
ncbi:MAG: hypothetical protein NUV48_07245 [Peptococcaceae bacterium]|jgi:hypothetical protein|nr:hypothetical protein [Peptococcaceae bacterium]